MLRITQSTSAKGAITYFDVGLAKSDYYQDKEYTVGRWNGSGKTKLNLPDEVERNHFARLAQNEHPITGEQLTPRMNEFRRVGYDFTFSVPKSISILHSLTDDKEIMRAFEKSVQKTMIQLEKDAETRVRIKGANENRVTGNLLHASFTHEEARPIDGIPDPHLHTHVFVFNQTFDSVEERWKAVDIANIKSNAPYYETMFHSELAKELANIGYMVQRNKRDFEIEGFDRKLIDKYSRRTVQMNKMAEELGLSKTTEKSELAARNREAKRKGYDEGSLVMQWRSRLSEREKEIVFGAKQSTSSSFFEKAKEFISNGRDAMKNSSMSLGASDAVENALNHHLERKSVTNDKDVLREAMKFSIGREDFDTISKELSQRKDLIRGKDQKQREVFTTVAALEEEGKLIDAVHAGKKRFDAINPNYEIKNQQLTEEQSGAVKHVLNSQDLVTIVSGGAGTGKTWSIKEVKEGVREAGMTFSAFAPSAAASRQVQRDEGFENATTVSELLQNKKLHNKIRDGVVWIDESGLLGVETMNQVMELAQKENARILLTGDIKQHNAVQRGDAQRIIQDFGGVEPARISKIKRQQITEYRNVVRDIAEGKVSQGFTKLNEMGAIQEHEDFSTLKKKVATEYFESVKSKQNTLVVATTHAQGKAITESIREKLFSEGVLKDKSKTYEIHENLGFGNVEKEDIANYQDTSSNHGLAIQFHQNMKDGLKQGARYSIIGIDEGKLLLTNSDGEKRSFVPDSNIRFSVYERKKIDLAKGDKIRVTQNGRAEDNKRLYNGNILTVTGFNKKGEILAKSTGKREIRLAKDFSNFTHGYYTTSPASQGKSVNKAIIVQSSMSGKAANKEQFYVSVSRGKFSVSVHTDDKETLLRNIQQSSKRMSATELKNSSTQHSKKQNRGREIYEQLRRMAFGDKAKVSSPKKGR